MHGKCSLSVGHARLLHHNPLLVPKSELALLHHNPFLLVPKSELAGYVSVAHTVGQQQVNVGAHTSISWTETG